MLVSSAYANGNYWAGADGKDGAVSDFDGRAGGEPGAAAGADACRDCARAGRSRDEIGGTFSAKKNYVRDGGIRGHWRTTKGPRERFGFAGPAARGGRADACGAAVRRSFDAASGRLARRDARYRERGNRVDAERSGAGDEAAGARGERFEEEARSAGGGGEKRAGALCAVAGSGKAAAGAGFQAGRAENDERFYVRFAEADADCPESRRRGCGGHAEGGRAAESVEAARKSEDGDCAVLRESGSGAGGFESGGSGGVDERVWIEGAGAE